ncbi:MAG: DegV family protein [Selenomonadales bacterium]|nr:DegV family protein [Selenomonadales bacterium]
MKPIIITDSTCDLASEYLRRNRVPTIPFHFTLKGQEYTDDCGRALPYQKFYDELRKGAMATTAQVTPFVYEDYFRRYIAEGHSIIYVGFSSALSGSYGGAVLARNEILRDHPGADISVLDTKSATVGQGLLVRYACEMLEQGRSKEDIVAWIEANKQRINTWFTVDSLEHLRRGGRLSATSASLGAVLSIKPILTIDKGGRLALATKVRGRQKAICGLMTELKDRIVNPEEQTILISHGDCLEDAERLKSLVMGELRVKEVLISYLGPVIGAHTGPGLLCLAFMGRERGL